MQTKVEANTEFVLEVEDLEPRTLPTAIGSGVRRKMAGGDLWEIWIICPDNGEPWMVDSG